MALQNYPEKAMERARIETTLGDIFELDYSEDPQPRYFDSKTRSQNGMKYRIPEHQRHPQWKSDQKNLLIDSIFRNYPMNGIVVSTLCANCNACAKVTLNYAVTIKY